MTSTSPQPTNNPIPLKLSSPISNCADLPLETYIQICLDGDHSRLGEGDTEAAWTAIQAEFDKLTGGTTQQTMQQLVRDINFMAAKLDFIYMLTAEMRKYYVPDYGQMLKEYGYHFEWVLVDEETYLKQIEMVESRAKTLYVKLLAKKKEWEKFTAEGKEVKITREYFEDWIVELSAYNGYAIDTHTISTYRFAVMIKRRNASPNKTTDTNKK